MRTRLISSLAIAALALSACGGGGGTQGEAADMLLEDAEEAGVDVDEGCVKDIADGFSDEDAQQILDSGGDTDDLSAAGEALTLDLASCVDTDSFVDSIIAQIGDQEGLDEDCLRDMLRDIDPAELAEGDMPEAVFECFDFGG